MIYSDEKNSSLSYYSTNEEKLKHIENKSSNFNGEVDTNQIFNYESSEKYKIPVLGNQIYISNKKTQYSGFLAENRDVNIGEYYTAMKKDKDFSDIFSEISLMENLFCNDFSELAQQKQIEILIKCFLFIKTEKVNQAVLIQKLEEELKSLEESEEDKFYNLIEKYKNESYSYKCERDDLKVKNISFKNKVEKYSTENDKLNEKITKLKEKLKQYENKKERFESDKRDMEARHKRLVNENSKIIESLEIKLKEAESKIEEIKSQLNEKEKQILLKNEQLKALEIKLSEFKERNDYLEIISKNTNTMLIENNNLLNELGINEEEINKSEIKKSGQMLLGTETNYNLNLDNSHLLNNSNNMFTNKLDLTNNFTNLISDDNKSKINQVKFDEKTNFNQKNLNLTK